MILVYLVLIMVLAIYIEVEFNQSRSIKYRVLIEGVRVLLIGAVVVFVGITIFNRDLLIVEEKLHDVYVMYQAYDDSEFNYEELKVIEKWMDDDKLFDRLVDGELTDREEDAYVEFVTEEVSRFDSSPGHVMFKMYVFQEEASSGD